MIWNRKIKPRGGRGKKETLRTLHDIAVTDTLLSPKNITRDIKEHFDVH